MASYWETYVYDYVDVELRGRMPDGKPPRLRLRQLSPIEWAATKVGFPITGIESEGPELTPEQYRAYMRDVVTRALIAMEIPDGNGGRRWQPVRLIPGTEAGGEWDLPMELFDRPMTPPTDRNIERCFNRLFADLKDGEPFDRVSGDSFRGGADGSLVGAVGEMPEESA